MPVFESSEAMHLSTATLGNGNSVRPISAEGDDGSNAPIVVKYAHVNG